MAHTSDKLEAAVLDIEKRRIQKEEGGKAQKALEALEVTKGSGAEVKSEDVEYIVRPLEVLVIRMKGTNNGRIRADPVRVHKSDAPRKKQRGL